MEKIILPSQDGNREIESVKNFVIIGANGSGKSRLGSWIENNIKDKLVLRISAQRALTIPDSITLKSEEINWNKIYYGHESVKDKHQKWGYDNTSKLINDYEGVLSAIFARKNKENEAYIKDCKEKEHKGLAKAPVPLMITDIIKLIWNHVFPHRQIEFIDAKVTAKKELEPYHAKGMSDGEKVAIYLMAQCLIAPEGTVVIIDEPEIHLHKSIMYAIWDKIEEFCSNKTIVYITHDLDFASSRKEATKIWVKEFKGKDQWDLEILPSESEIPDVILMEVLGNRKPVLLVEGEKGSYDNQLYSQIFPEYTVIPCHNCSNVINMTKAFNNEKIKCLHNYEVKGLIDRDYMSEQEIKAYTQSHIFTLEVAEVENLYLTEEILKIIANNQGFTDPKFCDSIKNFIFGEFEKEIEDQVLAICKKEIQYKLKTCSLEKGSNLSDLKDGLEKLKEEINIEEIYNVNINKLEEILKNQDYKELLKIYNQKGLIKKISKLFNLTNSDYPNLVLRLLKTDKKVQIINSVKGYLPRL